MEKIVISAAEFEKKVEIEAENLIYFDRLKKHEAFFKSRQTVSEKYTVDESR